MRPSASFPVAPQLLLLLTRVDHQCVAATLSPTKDSSQSLAFASANGLQPGSRALRLTQDTLWVNHAAFHVGTQASNVREWLAEQKVPHAITEAA